MATITNFFKPVSAEEHARRCESSQSKSAGTKRPAELPPKRHPGHPRKRQPDTCGRDSPVTAPNGVPITDAETESSEPQRQRFGGATPFGRKKGSSTTLGITACGQLHVTSHSPVRTFSGGWPNFAMPTLTAPRCKGLDGVV